VDAGKAKAAGRTATYKGDTYYFCSDECKDTFAKEPARYTGKASKGATTDAGQRLESIQWESAKTKEPPSAHMGHAHPPATPGASAGHR